MSSPKDLNSSPPASRTIIPPAPESEEHHRHSLPLELDELSQSGALRQTGIKAESLFALGLSQELAEEIASATAHPLPSSPSNPAPSGASHPAPDSADRERLALFHAAELGRQRAARAQARLASPTLAPGAPEGPPSAQESSSLYPSDLPSLAPWEDPTDLLMDLELASGVHPRETAPTVPVPAPDGEFFVPDSLAPDSYWPSPSETPESMDAEGSIFPLRSHVTCFPDEPGSASSS